MTSLGNDLEVKEGGAKPPISKPTIPMNYEAISYLISNEYENLDKNFLLEILQRILFFQNFDPDTVLKIFKNSKLRFLSKGDWLFREGEIGRCVFLVLSGSVDIVKKLRPDVLT